MSARPPSKAKTTMPHTRRPHPDRLYLCLEIDSFSAQVLSAYNPTCRRTSFVVVRQDSDSHRCTVWACSAPAREAGVEPGVSLQMLKKQHPDVQVMQRDPELESAACDDLRHILKAYTPDVELLSDGRGTLDISGMPFLKHADPTEIAERLRQEVEYKIGLEEMAFGISRNKLLADLLARVARPDRIQTCDPGQEETVLAGLHTNLLPGLSSRSYEQLRKYGLTRIEQIQRLGRDALICRLGKEGERVYSLTRGIDSRLELSVVSKPVSTETVLDRDINETKTLVQHVRLTADRLCHGLKKRELQARRVGFLLRYSDNRTAQRSAAFPAPTDNVATISHAAVGLFHHLYQRRVAIKSLTLFVKQPRRATGQLGLFESVRQTRQRRLEEAVTNVRQRMGFGSVLNGTYFGVKGRKLKNGKAHARMA